MARWISYYWFRLCASFRDSLLSSSEWARTVMYWCLYSIRFLSNHQQTEECHGPFGWYRLNIYWSHNGRQTTWSFNWIYRVLCLLYHFFLLSSHSLSVFHFIFIFLSFSFLSQSEFRRKPRETLWIALNWSMEARLNGWWIEEKNKERKNGICLIFSLPFFFTLGRCECSFYSRKFSHEIWDIELSLKYTA